MYFLNSNFQNFNENPYFEDPKLTKTFIFFGEGTTKITGTTIKWKEDTVIDQWLQVTTFIPVGILFYSPSPTFLSLLAYI